MADVRLTISGRFYDVSTSDGQEQQLIALSKLVDEKARAVLGTTETRQLLFAALMLADELQEARASQPKTDAAPDATSEALREELAAAKAREESSQAALAEALEKIAALEAAAEAAAAEIANAPKPAPTNGPALAALADRIEQLADKFEQLV